MTLRNMIVDHNSEEVFRDRFINTLASGAGCIHVRTNEIMRTLLNVRNLTVLDGSAYFEWDIRNGFREFTTETINNTVVQGDGQANFIQNVIPKIWEKYHWYLKEATEQEQDVDYIYVMVNPHYQLGNAPAAYQSFMELCYALPETSIKLVMITGDIQPDPKYSEYFVDIEFDRPGHGELLGRLTKTLRDWGEDDDSVQIEEDEYDSIAVAGAGMLLNEFEFAVSNTLSKRLALVNDEDAVVRAPDLVKGVGEAKTEVVKKNEILELLQSGDIQDVGGMHHAKEWVSQRANCYSDEAAAFGIDHPKGMVSVGVPGSGKSLLAKAVAGVLGIPCVRLDFGAVFNSFVGSSEAAIRNALKLVESMAPVVLFVDEIDKGLGGMGGSGDSGTSMRVFGTFLTWLQENDKPVFTMVTANNVTGLPPELLRRGRFDAIFSTTMPNEFEREDVLAIHLRKRGHDIDDFSDQEIASFLSATNECVPAEIESIVQDALVLAFNDNMADPVLEMDHLLQARAGMVPLFESHKEAIERMVQWAKNNAIPASFSEDEIMEKLGRTKRSTGKAAGKRKTAPRGRRKPAKGDSSSSNVTSLASRRKPRKRKDTDDE